MRWAAVVLAVVCAIGTAAAGRAPAPCKGIRYVTELPIPEDARQVIVTDEDGPVSIPGLCDPTRARRSVGAREMLVRARWPACGAASRVRLRMRYADDCAAATGVLRVRHASHVRFTAAPSSCGDDFLDEDEDCEASIPCADGEGQCIACQCIAGTSTTTVTSTSSTLVTTTTTPVAPTTTTTSQPGTPTITSSTTSSTSSSTTTTTLGTTTSSSVVSTTTSTTLPGATTTSTTSSTTSSTSSSTTTTTLGTTTTSSVV